MHVYYLTYVLYSRLILKGVNEFRNSGYRTQIQRETAEWQNAANTLDFHWNSPNGIRYVPVNKPKFAKPSANKRIANAAYVTICQLSGD